MLFSAYIFAVTTWQSKCPCTDGEGKHDRKKETFSIKVSHLKRVVHVKMHMRQHFSASDWNPTTVNCV